MCLVESEGLTSLGRGYQVATVPSLVEHDLTIIFSQCVFQVELQA